jgi:phage FluMu protein Com
MDWHHWADEMKKSYTQKRCPVCKLLVILELKSDASKRPRYSRRAYQDDLGKG